MENMDPSMAWTLLVGGLAPLLVAVVNQPRWSTQRRQIVAVAISLVLGFLSLVVGNVITDWSLTLPNVVFILSAVVGAAQATYTFVWKPSKAAPSLEAATSPAVKPEAEPGRHRAVE